MDDTEEYVELHKRRRPKFKSFSERIKAIKVNGIHKVQRVEPSLETENSSKLSDCLVKWRTLDLTAQFKSCSQEMWNKSRSYKMVVHYQNDLSQILERCLQEKDTLALQSLLELVVALSADLGPDFYPRFFKFFPILTDLLKTNNPKKLEWIFVAISLLFHNLWRYMVDDIENVLDLYKTLLIGSHPFHVASFAGESISFLLRKVKDPKLVFIKLFDILTTNPSAEVAVAKVIFHMFKSSQNQFYSKTETLLPVILQLCKSNVDSPEYSSISKCVEIFIELLAEHSKKEYGLPVWKPLIAEVHLCTKKDISIVYATNLVRYINIWCKSRKGAKVVSEKDLLNSFSNCLSLLTDAPLSCDTIELYSSLCELTATIFTSKLDICFDKKVDIISALVNKVHNFEAISKLWYILIKQSKFSSSYLEIFLRFSLNWIQIDDYKMEIVKLMVQYSVVDLSLPQDSQELTAFKPHLLDFTFVSMKQNSLKPYDILSDLIAKSNSLSDIWYCLVLLLSLKPLNNKLKKITKNLFFKLIYCEEFDDEKLTVLSMCCQVCCKLYDDNLFQDLKSEHFMSFFVDKYFSKHCLFVIDVILSKTPVVLSEITEEQQQNLMNLLEKNMLSPDPVVRRLSLRALLHVDGCNAVLYEACLAVEDVPASFLDIRTKVHELSKLQQLNIAEFSKMSKRIVIYFLISNFYVNFLPLQKPIQEVLSSFCSANSKDPIWDVFVDSLTKASHILHTADVAAVTKNEKSSADDLFHCVVFGHVKQKFVSNDRINHVNFRILLWKTLCMLPHPKALEMHVDDLLTLFHEFLGKEFFRVDHQLSPCVDLSNYDSCNITDEQRAHATTLLVTMFKVFARFSKLKSHPKSDSLLQLFTDFLGHSNNNLQVSAFKCILSYKNAFVLKYKDTLLSFLDEKKFRDIISQFSINDLSTEERPIVMNILLQILYGKMKTKEKFGASGNASPVTRRALIVRFLCGITNSEISLFAEMLCRPYIKYIDSLNLDQYESIVNSLQCSKAVKFISAGKQHAILKCIQLVVVECSQSLSPDTYTWLFKLLLQVDSINNAIVENKTHGQVAGQLITSLKNVNKLATDCILDLIASFPDTSCFDPSIIDMFFNTHVWTKLPKLVHESSGKPGFLLKVFGMFAKTSTCLPLLAKLNPLSEDDQLSSPIAAVTNLLVSQKCSSDVGSFVIDMLMSSLEEPELDDDDVMMETDEAIPDAAECFEETIEKAVVASGKLYFEVTLQQKKSKLDFAMAVMKPYLGKVLTYFLRKMKSSKRGYVLPNNYLQFLSAVGKVITEKDLLSDFAELLLDHVTSATAKKRTDDENKNDSYTLCLNALSTIIRDTKHIDKIARLFSRLTERHHRNSLVSILQSACRHDPDFQWTCDVVTKLNAWHKRRVSEIDFESRITGLDDIAARMKSADDVAVFDQDCRLFLPVVHCCLHTLKAFPSDLSLKESVMRIFELLAKKVNDLFAFDFDYAYVAYQKLIQQLLLPCIQDGLNSSDPDVRFDRIKLLSVAVTYFPNEPSLRGLDALRNEKDIEADSFENLRHIQAHRRARAYTKLATVLREQHSLSQSALVGVKNDGIEEIVDDETRAKSKFASRKVISCETAMKYIFPIAAQSLYNDSFRNASNLFDACLELYKVCVLIAPWRLYKKQLIKTMTDTQNTSHQVRFKIVCSLLNAFPYDLSMYDWKNAEAVSAERTISQDFVVEQKCEASSDSVECSVSQSEILSRNRLSAAEAEFILTDVNRLILPSLYDLFSVQDQSVSKVIRRSVTLGSSERKLPYALPMILLLKKLPESIMESNLPTVLLNIFAFLKHREFEVRNAAMQSIIKVLEALGFRYFNVILKQLNLTLVNGFQRQLIHYVVHCMIDCLLPNAKVGVFDESLSLLLDVAYESLLGKVADKKEEDVLKQSLPELKGGIKTFSLYRNISKYVQKQDFATVLEPFKAKLIETHSSKETRMIATALSEIANGFLCNEDLQLKDTLKLIHGLVTDNISSLFPENNDKFAADKSKDQRPESCLILPSVPKRYGAAPIVKTASTNIHVLVEFALNLLKRLLDSNLNAVEQETLEMLDPLVPHLTRCLKSSHAGTVVGAVNCLSKLYRTSLPSMQSNSKAIIKSLFKLTQQNSNEMGNADIANSSFHSLRVLCTSDYGKSLSVTQLKMLLSYAETDMHDESRSSKSFKLIKTIMMQGLQCKELVEVIVKVRSVIIQSQSPICQDQARALYLHFLSNYAMLPSQLESQLNFVLSNLTYEYESGRLSALKILGGVATTFPDKLLNENAGILFVPIAALMINDESETCRRNAGSVVKSLLRRLDQETNDQLFSFVLQWFSAEDSILQQRLGAMAICLFAEVETYDVNRHVKKILELLLQNVRNVKSNDENSDQDVDVTSTDHTLFHLLTTFLSVLVRCKISRSLKHREHLSPLFDLVESFLGHPHNWVQLISSQIFGCAFSEWDPSEVTPVCRTPCCWFTPEDLESKLKSLVNCFYFQVKACRPSEQLADQVVKNLLYLTRVFDNKYFREGGGGDVELASIHPGILTILRKLTNCFVNEQFNQPLVTCRRVAVLKYCAAFCVKIDQPERVISLLLDPICRGVETSVKHDADQPPDIRKLKKLSHEVLDLAKSKIDKEEFPRIYMKVNRSIKTQRNKRKAQEAQRLVTDPIKSANRKLQKNKARRMQLKRKAALKRPEYGQALKQPRMVRT